MKAPELAWHRWKARRSTSLCWNDFVFWHGAGGDGDDDGDGGGDDARWCVVAMVMEVIVRVIETIIISRSFVCACACACVCTFWSFGLHICICTIHIRVVAKELSRRPSTCSFGPYRVGFHAKPISSWLPRQTVTESHAPAHPVGGVCWCCAR